ncbi:hypothetical protein FB107DRAFT_290632 [Schizophyllum commune]
MDPKLLNLHARPDIDLCKRLVKIDLYSMPKHTSTTDDPWRCAPDALDVLADECESTPSQDDTEVQERASTSSIQSLPPELLGLVFTQFIGDVHLRLVHTDPIWTIVKVCRMWRDVAHDLPTLWTRIDTYTPARATFASKNISKSIDRVLEARLTLETYLARSHDHPLELRISLHPWDGWEHILKLLWAERHRWEDITFSGVGLKMLQDIMADGDDSGFLLLRQFNWLVSSSNDITRRLPFLPAPNLHRLTLAGEVRPSRLALPWSQITHYAGPGISCRNTLILSLMPNLEVCALQGNGMRHGTEDLAVHQLPRLRVLGLAWHHPHTCLPFIDAPALEKAIVMAPEFTLPGSLFSFIQRSGGANVTTLSVYYDMSPVSTYNIIQACPRLRTLVLRQSPEFALLATLVEDSVMHLFSLLADARPPLLTELEVLKIAPAPVLSDEDEEEEVARAMRLAGHLASLEPRRLQNVGLYVGDVKGTRYYLDEVYKEPAARANVTVHATAELRFSDDFEELSSGLMWKDQ